MKKRLVSTIIVSMLSLTACSLFGENSNYISTYQKKIEVYNIDRLDSGGNLADCLTNTINARFVEGQDFIPYVTLKQYASLYESHFDSSTKSSFENALFSEVWTIKKGEDPYFAAQLSSLLGQVYVAGSIQAALKEDDDPRDLEALNYGLKTDTEGKYLSGQGYAIYDFGGYDLSYFEYKNQNYYPLALLDLTFSDNSSIYFTYNYKHILSTRDVDKYSSLTYIDEGKEYTFDSQMEENSIEKIPNYLAEFNANLFLYTMDNFYGLKKAKGISSFAQYYKQRDYDMCSGIHNSQNDLERGLAYSDALSVLDDNHTLLVSANNSWGESAAGMRRRYGEGCMSRTNTRTALKELRQQTFGHADATDNIYYSNDRKTALFAFDSFAFGTSDEVFNSDDTIKETAKDHDTFFKVLDVFQKLKLEGTVENVILDISTNGGGVLGVMLKLLALISKDNNSKIALYHDSNSQLAMYTSHVDSNGDGFYDTEDCFGDDFNIYILTSDCSFSCGNAFPCAAQLDGSAKIIGQKSGGGECVVGVHYLPNSEYVYHSSNTHIGVANEDETEFLGFESGATPDIEIEIDRDFYSVDYLNNCIRNAR